MVRIVDERILSDSKRIIEAYGLSTDTKPTSKVANGSFFCEVNTGDVYAFDETSSEWNKVMALGGGS